MMNLMAFLNFFKLICISIKAKVPYDTITVEIAFYKITVQQNFVSFIKNST